MTRSTGQRKPHFKNTIPKDPALQPFSAWAEGNRNFYAGFRRWLRDGGYGDSALNCYGVAARLALGFLNQPYWTIDPETDLERVREHLTAHFSSAATRAAYANGLAKLAEYLRLRRQSPRPEKQVNWSHYLGPLPEWLAEQVQAYLAHCRRNWPAERHYRSTLELLSHLTGCLRWMAVNANLAGIATITPNRWYDYLETRLAAGISPVTSNNELRRLQAFLLFLESEEQPICHRMLLVEPLNEGARLPRDVPVEQLRRLLHEIQVETTADHANQRRMGLMDRAWFLLMLHGGLRTCEVRRLKPGDIDWENRRVRIEQSKGLKDRVVYLSQAACDALQAYLAQRGPASALPEQVFIYRHQPLSHRYCQVRLRTYGRRCGVQITPHQLRHSCGTLLLNAGAPVLTVQAILGHKHIDTTLRYARLYDGTLAADYYQAMAQVERCLTLEERGETSPPRAGDLLPLVDLLQKGETNTAQNATLQALRAGLIALVEQETNLDIANVKVLA
jgi:site-specific recombinase XerD